MFGLWEKWEKHVKITLIRSMSYDVICSSCENCSIFTRWSPCVHPAGQYGAPPQGMPGYMPGGMPPYGQGPPMVPPYQGGPPMGMRPPVMSPAGRY